MKLKIAFKQINSEYSQDYADEYQFGQESENNQKYHWSKSFLVNSDIDRVTIEQNRNLHYSNKSSDDEHYDLLIKNVTILKCYKNESVFSQYAVSSEFIEKSYDVFKENEDTRYCYFYLKDNKEFVELRNNNYVLEKDIQIINKK